MPFYFTKREILNGLIGAIGAKSYDRCKMVIREQSALIERHGRGFLLLPP